MLQLKCPEWLRICALSAGNKIVRDLRSKLFSSIIRQEVAFFDKNKTGELINRLSTDTSLVGQSVTMNISDGLRSIVQAFAGVSMMVCFSFSDAGNSCLYGNYNKNTSGVNDHIHILHAQMFINFMSVYHTHNLSICPNFNCIQFCCLIT
jgi:ABC-type multidrug transport system fused ATPase/permease subunit